MAVFAYTAMGAPVVSIADPFNIPYKVLKRVLVMFVPPILATITSSVFTSTSDEELTGIIINTLLVSVFGNEIKKFNLQVFREIVCSIISNWVSDTITYEDLHDEIKSRLIEEESCG